MRHYKIILTVFTFLAIHSCNPSSNSNESESSTEEPIDESQSSNDSIHMQAISGGFSYHQREDILKGDTVIQNTNGTATPNDDIYFVKVALHPGQSATFTSVQYPAVPYHAEILIVDISGTATSTVVNHVPIAVGQRNISVNDKIHILVIKPNGKKRIGTTTYGNSRPMKED